IERQTARKDRRVKMIALTSAGASLRSRLLARLFQPPAFIASLPEPEKQVLRDILAKALRHALAEPPAAPDRGGRWRFPGSTSRRRRRQVSLTSGGTGGGAACTTEEPCSERNPENGHQQKWLTAFRQRTGRVFHRHGAH